MPALVPPPARDQGTTRDADRFELCGETCVASALGLDVEIVVTWLRQHMGGEPAVRNGTKPRELISFCAGRAIGARLVHGPAPRYVAAATAQRHYALVAVWSDHQGNPISLAQSARLHPGGIGHWLLGYGTAGSKVQVMQPWGGKLLTYDLGGGRDQQYGVEILRPIAARASPATRGQPAPMAPARGPGRTYVVKSGDTLGAIARREGKSLAQMLAANPEITNKNLILVGQRLRIPN